jgi:hypothetical protein
MAFNVLQTPEFIQSAGNPMFVRVQDTNYAIGQLFYCEIWVVTDRNMRNVLTPKTTGKLLLSQTINGSGDGTARFDISSILNSVFIQDDYQTPPTLNPLQAAKEESAYIGYYFKAGYITYNAQNQQVKNLMYELPYVQWAVRAALPLAANNSNNFNSGNMLGYCYRHDGEPVRYATSIPDGTKRNRSEDTLLPFFCPYKDNATGAILQAQANLYFADGTKDTVYYATTNLTTGGLFVVNAYPGQFQGHLKYQQLLRYSVTIQYLDDQDPTPTDVTQARFFQVSKDIPFPNRVLFMNRLGGWDSIQVRRDTDTSIKFKASTFRSTYGSQNYSIDATSSITYYSSYLTQPEFAWLKDLKASPVIFLNGEYVLQQDGELKLDTSVGLFNYELTVAPAYDENTISL